MIKLFFINLLKKQFYPTKTIINSNEEQNSDEFTVILLKYYRKRLRYFYLFIL